MGRPAIPLAMHILNGTYRADRHGPIPQAAPVAPAAPQLPPAEPEIEYSPLDGYVDAQEIADALRVSRGTVLRWNRKGLMPKATRLPTGGLRWLEDEIKQWTAELRGKLPD